MEKIETESLSSIGTIGTTEEPNEKIINNKENEFEKAVFEAFKNGCYCSANLILLELKPNKIGSLDENGNTLLQKIIECYDKLKDFEKIISIYIPIYKDLLDHQNNDGNTALHLSVKELNEHAIFYGICGMLDKYGARSDIPNNEGDIVKEGYEEGEKTGTQNAGVGMFDGVKGVISSFVKKIFRSDSSEVPKIESLSEMLGINKKQEFNEDEKTEFEDIDIDSEEIKPKNRDFEIPKPFIQSTPAIKPNGIVNPENASNTESDFLNTLISKYNNSRKQFGGSKKKIYGGIRKLPETSTEANDEDTISRYRKSKTSELHEKAIDEIMKLKNVDKDIAKIYKSVAYRKIKKEYPDLGGYQRAVEMLKLIEKPSYLDNINIDKEIKLREKEKEEKEEKEKSKSEMTEETVINEGKDEKKKSRRKKKKQEGGTSERSIIPNISDLSITSSYYPSESL